MMNVGVRPTVSDGTRETIEVHLFGFEGELYGKKLRVTFLRRLRDEKRFSGVEDLVAQLREDREQALRIVHEYRHQHFTVSQKEQ
jgi:riboflavin kinase/FMN adenylyltransferase